MQIIQFVFSVIIALCAVAMFVGAVITPSPIKVVSCLLYTSGFYTTTNFEQAKKWALLKKNREQSEKAIVSVYEVPDDILDRESVSYTHLSAMHFS